MKEDPNLIFILRAISDYAKKAFELSQNKRYYVPSPPLKIVTAASQGSTPRTNIGYEDGEGDSDGRETWNAGDDREDFSHQLRFTFDQKPRNIQDGFVFGCNTKICDIILGNAHDGISGSHFRITFDDQDRLVLIDSSTHGTAVSYGGQARDEKRKNPPDRTQNKPRDKSNDFPWVLFPETGDKRVIIGHKIDELPNAPIIEFSVEVADPKSCKKQYDELRNAFLEEARTAVPFGLNIDSHLTTAGQTESHSPKQRPKQRPIWIDCEEIGSGQFATVYRAVDVSTGKSYAAKMFMRGGNDFRERWDREIEILRKVSHDHIVKFEDHDAERKWPRLIMEYLPLGNLAEQDGISRITEWEIVTFLCQGLDALDYLHFRNIVHRDLKPENILVQCREPANFYIKIADFGLAKDDSFLVTFCGTQLYAAPEIWENRPYTPKVDIWSLGLITFQYLCGLPKVPKVKGKFHPERWYQELVRAIDDWGSNEVIKNEVIKNEVINFLKSSMLRIDPLQRLSASECLKESPKLREAITPAQIFENDLGTPTEKMSSSVIMAAEEAKTWIDFPTLSTLKSDWRSGEYPETITQIWNSPTDGGYRSNEDERSQQEVGSGAEKGSDTRRSKRQRTEKPDVELPPNSQQKSWKRYKDQVLIEDPPSGCIQMTLEEKAVSMRKSDCSLNATQIIGLAGKTTGERDQILRTLKQHATVRVVSTRHPKQSWIPYQDGRFLCEFLQLTDTLRPLLEYGLKQCVNFDNRTNYFLESEFLEVTADNATVFIRKTDLRINATHILNAGSCDRRTLAKVRKRERENCDIVQGGAAASQGTYVDPLIGLKLCNEYSLSSLERILRKTLEDHGYCQPAASAPRLATMEVNAAELPHSTNQEPKTGSSTDQGLPQTRTASNLGINDAAKLSEVSYYSEAGNGSFFPLIKESFMPA